MRNTLFLVTLLTGSMMASAVSAQSGTLNRFRASETPEDDFELSRPTDFGHLRFGAQLHLDYGLNPLVYESTAGDSSTERFSIVEHQLTGNLGLSLGLFDRLVIFAGLPVRLVMDGSDPTALPFGIAPADGFGLGDLYFGARARLFGDVGDEAILALQVSGTAPTSGDSRYGGDPSMSLHPELLAEIRPAGHLRIVLNVGARIREETANTTYNLQFGHELTYGVGIAQPLWVDQNDTRTHLDGLAQLYGSSAFALFGDREGTSLEATVGMKLFHQSGIVAGLAGGPGLTRGFGTPDVRLIASIAWMMPEALPDGDRDHDGLVDSADECPDEPEDIDSFEDADGCPDPDNDQDTILDTADSCPLQPETVNEFDDEDGCPDEIPDTDGDGLFDNVDQCVNEPEDADGFEDEDGCPDPDNDEDTVLDTDDRCPLEPGPVSNQGCPDPDRDNDTVVDRVDNCPDVPGTVENHGCAEQQQVVLREGRLEILEKVFFRTNRATIRPRSFELLRNVATVLNAHPEIQRIRVEGHTDSRGRHARNMTLSQQRAEAVVAFLVEQGEVAAERLEAQGFGPDRPIVEDASNSEQHAQNRRVEFNIPTESGIEQAETAADEDTVDR